MLRRPFRIRPAPSAGFPERVHDLQRPANNAAWQVLRVEARNAAFQTGGHDPRVPERPSVLYVENASSVQRALRRQMTGARGSEVNAPIQPWTETRL